MIGLHEATIGLREAMIGLHEAMIGLREAMIGLHEATIGLHEAMDWTPRGHDWPPRGHDWPPRGHDWPRDAMIDLREAMIDLREATIGLHEAMIGLREATIGLHEAMIGFHKVDRRPSACQLPKLCRRRTSARGPTWVWTRSAGVWTQQSGKLVGSGAAGAGEQGFSVSLSADGKTALAGGREDNNNAGAVWVFTRAVPQRQRAVRH